MELPIPILPTIYTALVNYSEVIFEQELDSRFKCPVCHNPLKEPVQTGCGHRWCNECLQKILRDENPQCPFDEEPLSPSEVFKDVCCKREVLGLICFCLNRKYGCERKKELLYLEDHLPVCEYREVPCENEGCEEMIPMKKLPQHMKETCRYKTMSCPHCGKHVPEIEMKTHLSKCEKVPITCQYCEMTGILREQEKGHIENQCEAAENPCEFKHVGCLFKGKLEELTEHYDAQKDEHLNLTVQSMDSSKKEEEHLKEKVEKIKKERTQNASSSKVGKSSEASLQLEELRSALADQEEKLRSLERELARGNIAGGGVRSLSSSSLTMDRRFDRNDHQLALHDTRLAEHDLKIQMLEATSYDGTYTWKIDEFSRRNHEGIIGKTPSIYSPPFYVGRYGYKVCARLSLDGDGVGKGTLLPLFLEIMQGEYDALLPWPFRLKVTFKLLDQNGQQDITGTFRPDPNSWGFERPTSNSNIASSCPLFMPQQMIESGSYVRDDTLFIKIVVDNEGSSTEAHLSECEEVPITCQYCEMTGILRGQEKGHIENQCEAVEKPCKFKHVGCLFKDAASSEVSLQLEKLRSALADQEEKLRSLERDHELARDNIAGESVRSLSSSSPTLDNTMYKNSENQLVSHNIQLAEHDLKIQMLEATSYDGTYIWKIDEFSRRNHEGTIGKTPYIYSPPFYVGRQGYKVCGRVYANGDDVGKGTHLSLFFVIMKGEYDALLPWPFRQKVTFKLLDQDRQQDVTHTFSPDPDSSSFKRPTSDMNIASGCPLFVSQKVIESGSYVRDDTLFIKIIVDKGISR